MSSTSDYKTAFTAFRAQIDALDISAFEAVDLGKSPPAPAALVIVRQRWAHALERLKTDIARDSTEVGLALANAPTGDRP